MKKIAIFLSLTATLSGVASAQEGFSPTLPFGTREYRTQAPVQQPTRPCNPYQDHYYWRNQWNSASSYYYGPNGAYFQQAPAPQANYRDWGQNSSPGSRFDDVLPSYRNSSSSSGRIPGY